MATRAKLVVSSVEASDVTTDATACAGWCDRLAESVNADAEVIAALRAAAGMLATAAGRIDADAAIVATARGMATRYYDETIETRDRIAKAERDRDALNDRLGAKESECADLRGRLTGALREASEAVQARDAARSLRAVDSEPTFDPRHCGNMERAEAFKRAAIAVGRVHVTSAVVYPDGRTVVEIAWVEPRATTALGFPASGRPRYDFDAHTGEPLGKAPKAMVHAVAAVMDSMRSLAVAS